MRIIDAEPELFKDIMLEIKVVDSSDRDGYVVHVGHHPTLGKIVVIGGTDGRGSIVELE